MSNEEKRGLFIVLEGCDRCGKTTQFLLLQKHFNEKNNLCFFITFPNRNTEIGKKLNKYLQNKNHSVNNNMTYNRDNCVVNKSIHDLFSQNRWEFKNEIEQKLRAGYNVICDRYSYSGIVYSICNGISIDYSYSTEIGLPKPDILFYFNTSIEILQNRNGYGDEKYETIEFQKRVKQYYEMIIKNSIHQKWITIDASQSIETIHQHLIEIIMNFIISSNHIEYFS